MLGNNYIKKYLLSSARCGWAGQWKVAVDCGMGGG